MNKPEFSIDIVFFAFRYCLGRHTGVVDTCVEYLIRNWEHLTANDRGFIVRETNRYLSGEDVFKTMSKHDKQQWGRIVDMDRLTMYHVDGSVKEKIWYENYYVCPNCSGEETVQAIATNGRERWCEKCGLKEKVNEK